MPEPGERKFPEIPVLENYDTVPDPEFWDKFPSRQLNRRPRTKINVKNLRKLVDEAGDSLSKTEKRRANRAIKDLTFGAEAYQKVELPPVETKNAKSAFTHGILLTDKIATWIEDGFVAGPFVCPPVAGFRTNPLMAVERNGKVRPVLNMSGPRGASFNDNVDKRKLERVHMATAKKFSFALRKAGRGARFSKFDVKDAYKLIPCKTKDTRLQGFSWLGRYFCKTQGTFGGIGSVCNFD